MIDHALERYAQARGTSGVAGAIALFNPFFEEVEKFELLGFRERFGRHEIAQLCCESSQILGPSTSFTSECTFEGLPKFVEARRCVRRIREVVSGIQKVGGLDVVLLLKQAHGALKPAVGDE